MFLNHTEKSSYISPDTSTAYRLLYEHELAWNKIENDMMLLEHKAIIENNIQLYNEGVSDFMGKVKRWFQWLGAEFVRYIDKIIDFWTRQGIRFKTWLFNLEQAKKLKKKFTMSKENLIYLNLAIGESMELEGWDAMMDMAANALDKIIANGGIHQSTEVAGATVAVKEGEAEKPPAKPAAATPAFLFEGHGPLTQVLLNERGMTGLTPEQQQAALQKGKGQAPEQQQATEEGDIKPVSIQIKSFSGKITVNASITDILSVFGEALDAARAIVAQAGDNTRFTGVVLDPLKPGFTQAVNFAKDGRVKYIKYLQKWKNEFVKIINSGIKSSETTNSNEVSIIKRTASKVKEFFSFFINSVNRATNALISAVESGTKEVEKKMDNQQEIANAKKQFLFENSDNKEFIKENGLILFNENYYPLANINENYLFESENFERLLNERAEWSWNIFDDFGREGKDYRQLRSLYKEAIKYHDLSDADLNRHGSGFLHFFKRFLQYWLDFVAICNLPLIFFGVGIIMYFINRCYRLLVDTAEYNNMEKDFNRLIKELEYRKQKANGKDKAKLEKTIEELKAALKKTGGELDY